MSNKDTNQSPLPKECIWKEKYKKMGVTAVELYLRQQGKCWLELPYDIIEDELTIGNLYCTDGKDYALTDKMLNPTFECVKCITNFFIEREQDKLMQNKLDKLIVDLLQAISKSRQEGEPEFNISKNTFDVLETHINSASLFSNETNPIKVTASADLLLFGCKVIILKDMEPGLITVQPGNITLKVQNGQQSPKNIREAG